MGPADGQNAPASNGIHFLPSFLKWPQTAAALSDND
jgi:hypothetical protein